MEPDHQLRAEAVHRLKSRAAFWRTAATFVVISVMLTVVWALSGQGYFWPAWAMLGMGVALLFMGVGLITGASSQISEAKITAEMDKLRQQQS